MARLNINYSEEQLQNYLIKNIATIFPELEVIKSEFPIPNGRIDILCREINYKNNYWVIELKAGDIVSDSVIQVLRYTQYLNSEMSKYGKRKFRPLIIGQNISKYESEHLIKLLKYYDQDYNEYSFYCFYRLYALNTDLLELDFSYINTQNDKFIENSYKIKYSYMSEIEYLEMNNYFLTTELKKGKKDET